MYAFAWIVAYTLGLAALAPGFKLILERSDGDAGKLPDDWEPDINCCDLGRNLWQDPGEGAGAGAGGDAKPATLAPNTAQQMRRERRCGRARGDPLRGPCAHRHDFSIVLMLVHRWRRAAG